MGEGGGGARSCAARLGTSGCPRVWAIASSDPSSAGCSRACRRAPGRAGSQTVPCPCPPVSSAVLPFPQPAPRRLHRLWGCISGLPLLVLSPPLRHQELPSLQLLFKTCPFSILPAASLDLRGPSEIEGVWKGSVTLPCVYVPVQDFVQQTLTWTVVHDQSLGTVFRRDGSGDHILLSKYRDRVSVPKDTPGNVSLHILNLEMGDRGTYTCQVTWTASNNSLAVKEITMKVEVVRGKHERKLCRSGWLAQEGFREGTDQAGPRCREAGAFC